MYNDLSSYALAFWIPRPRFPFENWNLWSFNIFYIVGLSMALVYHNKFNNKSEFKNFWFRRIFRIAPLFFVVILLSILPGFISGEYQGWKLFLFNVSLLFGFVKPDAYIAVGAWSIGNEMVYYLFTPFIILLYNWKLWMGNLITFLFILIGIYFSDFLLVDFPNVGEAWSTYVNPFNNMFFFVSGIFLYYNFKNINFNQNYYNYILVVAILLFILMPIDGDKMNLITGLGRWVLAFLSICIVLGFYKLTIKLPHFLSYSLEQLGLATYGVYLIHPIVYKYGLLLNLDQYFNESFVFLIVCVVTVGISLLSYYNFELIISNYGKKMIHIKKDLVNKII